MAGSKPVTIVAFSDLHRDVRAANSIVDAAKEADVVVGAGDFATCGAGLEETLEILYELPCPFVLVHGNHDNSDRLQRLTDDWQSAHLLHGTTVEIDGLMFFGLGGEVPIRNKASWTAGMSEAAAASLLADCPEDAILVTHTPPLGQCDLQADGTFGGSAALLQCVQRTQPRHVLCGHIHHAWDMRAQIGSTRVSNLGPRPTVLQVQR